MWDLYGCGNSTPVEEAGFTLKVIESLGTRKGGVIEGLVTESGTYPINSDLSGITIQIRSQGRDYEATTNARGEFKAHVPAGRYVVVVPSQHGRTFQWDNLDSYEDPNNVLITNGGGAQVQFERK